MKHNQTNFCCSYKLQIKSNWPWYTSTGTLATISAHNGKEVGAFKSGIRDCSTSVLLAPKTGVLGSTFIAARTSARSRYFCLRCGRSTLASKYKRVGGRMKKGREEERKGKRRNKNKIYILICIVAVSSGLRSIQVCVETANYCSKMLCGGSYRMSDAALPEAADFL